jgi:hypothetical protein
MNYSVITQEAGMYFYRYSEEYYPNLPKGTYAFNQAILDFQQSLKYAKITEEDVSVLIAHVPKEEHYKLKTDGVPVKYDDLEFYSIGGKDYVRHNKGNKTPKQEEQTIATPITQTPTTANTYNMQKVEPQLNVPYTPQNLNIAQDSRFYFDIIIDEQTGEPVLQFNFDNYAETTEKKLLKSFIIKSAKFGIELSKVDGSTHTISIKN